jgi:hypothetical protein
MDLQMKPIAGLPESFVLETLREIRDVGARVKRGEELSATEQEAWDRWQRFARTLAPHLFAPVPALDRRSGIRTGPTPRPV